jgi:hypothetical protein
MVRKELPAVLGICALVLTGLTAIVALFALSNGNLKFGSKSSVPGTNPRTGQSPNQVRNSLYSLSDTSAAQQLGPAVAEYPGVIGNSDPMLGQFHPNAKTLVFQGSGGHFYAVFDYTNGEWICVGSEFLPDDEFDLK